MAFSRIVGSVKLIGLILIGAAGLSGLSQSNNPPQPPSPQAPAEQRPEETSSSPLRKVKEWRTAIAQHNPGKADPAAVKISSFRAKDVDYIIDFITKMAAKPVKSARREFAKGPIRRLLDLTDREYRFEDGGKPGRGDVFDA